MTENEEREIPLITTSTVLCAVIAQQSKSLLAFRVKRQQTLPAI